MIEMKALKMKMSTPHYSSAFDKNELRTITEMDLYKIIREMAKDINISDHSTVVLLSYM